MICVQRQNGQDGQNALQHVGKVLCLVQEGFTIGRLYFEISHEFLEYLKIRNEQIDIILI